jgi:hypothetical protein
MSIYFKRLFIGSRFLRKWQNYDKSPKARLPGWKIVKNIIKKSQENYLGLFIIACKFSLEHAQHRDNVCAMPAQNERFYHAQRGPGRPEPVGRYGRRFGSLLAVNNLADAGFRQAIFIHQLIHGNAAFIAAQNRLVPGSKLFPDAAQLAPVGAFFPLLRDVYDGPADMFLNLSQQVGRKHIFGVQIF